MEAFKQNGTCEPLELLQGGSEVLTLDPSSKLIIQEAKKRGIAVEILAARAEYFRLSHGTHSILCRESLSELTSAVALSICDDKRTTTRVLREAGLFTPEQREAGTPVQNEAFLSKHGALVVKPSRGEQGCGVSVGVRTPNTLARAIQLAADCGAPVLLEQLVAGEDLRLIVIGHELVAAAVRCPPRVIGDGQHSVRELIAAQSRRRQAATAGESKIPIDSETERCIAEAGYTLASVLPANVELTVRRAANLHQGGTIDDVTNDLHPELREVAKRAALALQIPVVGLDLIVTSPLSSARSPSYWIIEANERPGLANHEPQPTAARFVDLLFPETASRMTHASA